MLSSFQDFIEEALRIIKAGKKKRVPLRLMGSLAVRVHCPKYGYLHEEMKRVPTDIDMATYSKFKDNLKEFLPGLGYNPDPRMQTIPYLFRGRHMYIGKTKLDIFFDKLRMCHLIDWRKRLELDTPTIPLADILLEKMQIVQINPKDIKDTIILMLEHDVGDVEGETVNAKYIAELLSKDWGFYYTATTNLKKVKSVLDEFSSLSDDDRRVVSTRIDEILDRIEKQKKSFGWKMRAKIGTKKKWYKEVGEIRVCYGYQ